MDIFPEKRKPPVWSPLPNELVQGTSREVYTMYAHPFSPLILVSRETSSSAADFEERTLTTGGNVDSNDSVYVLKLQMWLFRVGHISCIPFQ